MTETFTADEVRAHLARECETAGGQKAWATRNGISAAYLNDVLLGRREPGDGILKPLGLRRVVLYEDAAR